MVSGVGVNIATDIVCDPTVATVNFLYVAKMICDSMFSWTVCKWEVPHCMQV